MIIIPDSKGTDKNPEPCLIKTHLENCLCDMLVNNIKTKAKTDFLWKL